MTARPDVHKIGNRSALLEERFTVNPTRVAIEKTATTYRLVQSSPEHTVVIREDRLDKDGKNVIALFQMRKHGAKLASHYGLRLEDQTVQ